MFINCCTLARVIALGVPPEKGRHIRHHVPHTGIYWYILAWTSPGGRGKPFGTNAWSTSSALAAFGSQPDFAKSKQAAHRRTHAADSYTSLVSRRRALILHRVLDAMFICNRVKVTTSSGNCQSALFGGPPPLNSAHFCNILTVKANDSDNTIAK